MTNPKNHLKTKNYKFLKYKNTIAIFSFPVAMVILTISSYH